MNQNNKQNYLNVYYCILENMIQKMLQAPLSNSISYNFIVMMIPHHQAAIEMCANVLRYTKNETLQNITFQIIHQQTQSIKNMLNIIEDCKCCTNSHEELSHYHQHIDQILCQMFNGMKNARVTQDITSDFIYEMIPHHQGAIYMSKETLDNKICPQLKPILENIISLQEQGIKQMSMLLQQIEEC